MQSFGIFLFTLLFNRQIRQSDGGERERIRGMEGSCLVACLHDVDGLHVSRLMMSPAKHPMSLFMYIDRGNCFSLPRKHQQIKHFLGDYVCASCTSSIPFEDTQDSDSVTIWTRNTANPTIISNS
jgi:hypothetical protein